MGRSRIAVIIAFICCIALLGALLTACSSVPEETVTVSEVYAKILAIEGADQYDPAVLDMFARRIEEEDLFLKIYTEDWKLEQDGDVIRLSCSSPLNGDYQRSYFTLFYDGNTLFLDAFTRREFPNSYMQEVHDCLYTAGQWELPSVGIKESFFEYLLNCDWFPDSTQWDQYETEWYYDMVPRPTKSNSEEYMTLFIKFWEAGTMPDGPYTLRSIYIGPNGVRDRGVEQIDPNAKPTEPAPTEIEPTEPLNPFVKEESPSYQKLLTLPNAEEFLCNRFGKNELAILAEWIDSLEGVMETYPERWYLRHYGDDGTGFFCYSPLEEDNSCDYMNFTLWYGGDIITAPATGRRYFTDIPREEIAELVYGAYDPLAVDRELKERMIDYALFSEYFAWNVMEPEFRILDSYYEIITIWPYPEYEPDNYFERITLAFHVWRPGMTEGDYIKCWLGYDKEMNQIHYSSDATHEGFLSGIIPKG